MRAGIYTVLQRECIRHNLAEDYVEGYEAAMDGDALLTPQSQAFNEEHQQGLAERTGVDAFQFLGSIGFIMPTGVFLTGDSLLFIKLVEGEGTLRRVSPVA